MESDLNLNLNFLRGKSKTIFLEIKTKKFFHYKTSDKLLEHS